MGLEGQSDADPVHHASLFKMAEKNLKDIENDDNNFKRYNFLLKLFDKANIINEINQD